MKRILHITYSLDRNGTETFIMNVWRNIDHGRFMFDFLVNKVSEEGFTDEVRDMGSEIYQFPKRNKGIRNQIRQLDAFFKENAGKYAAVHYSANSFTNIMPVIMAKKYGIPVRIVHSHNTSTSGLHNRLLHRLNRKRIGDIATHYLACGREAAEWGYKGSSVYGKALVVPNGIELDKFRYDANKRSDTRQNLGIADSTTVVGNTAAFRAVKNHQFLINIFEEIKAIEPDSVLLLCGAGDTEAETRKLVKAKGLEDSVRFLGVRTDIDSLLSAMDVYVFPSLYEGLPFALIEAQAAGLPILASDTISPEIDLTPYIHFMSLNQTAKEWAEKAVSMRNSERKGEIHEGLTPYDINTTCRILEEIYSLR